MQSQAQPIGVPVARASEQAELAFTRPALFTPEELEDFKACLSPLIGLELDAYKPRQMARRITALMCRANVSSLSAFHTLLTSDPQRLRDFIDGLTINVTEFFRNPEKFDELAQQILPALLTRFGRLRVWSAGCSLGAELYSIGVLLEELGALEQAELIGTDLDRNILQRAIAGHFGEHELGAVTPERRARYFTTEEKGARFHSEAIRAHCRFERQNLLQDAPIPECHLIVCRNVVIYFNDESKQTLYRRFQEALAPGGILFVGNTERIFDYRTIGLELVSPFFYRKPIG